MLTPKQVEAAKEFIASGRGAVCWDNFVFMCGSTGFSITEDGVIHDFQTRGEMRLWLISRMKAEWKM